MGIKFPQELQTDIKGLKKNTIQHYHTSFLVLKPGIKTFTTAAKPSGYDTFQIPEIQSFKRCSKSPPPRPKTNWTSVRFV